MRKMYPSRGARSLTFMLCRQEPGHPGRARRAAAFAAAPGLRFSPTAGRCRPASPPFFRKAREAAPLTREESVRQGKAVRLAQAALGSVEAVRAFLNTHHELLGGRPIDIAVASDAGLVAVEAAIPAAATGPVQAIERTPEAPREEIRLPDPANHVFTSGPPRRDNARRIEGGCPCPRPAPSLAALPALPALAALALNWRRRPSARPRPRRGRQWARPVAWAPPGGLTGGVTGNTPGMADQVDQMNRHINGEREQRPQLQRACHRARPATAAEVIAGAAVNDSAGFGSARSIRRRDGAVISPPRDGRIPTEAFGHNAQGCSFRRPRRSSTLRSPRPMPRRAEASSAS